MTVDDALVYLVKMDKASFFKVAQEPRAARKIKSSLLSCHICSNTVASGCDRAFFFYIAHTLSIKTIALLWAEISPLWIHFVRKLNDMTPNAL